MRLDMDSLSNHPAQWYSLKMIQFQEKTDIAFNDDMNKRFRKWNGPIWHWSPSNVTLYIFVLFVDLKLAMLWEIRLVRSRTSACQFHLGGTGGTSDPGLKIQKICCGSRPHVMLMRFALAAGSCVLGICVSCNVSWFTPSGLRHKPCLGLRNEDDGFCDLRWFKIFLVGFLFKTAIDPRSSRRLQGSRRRELETSGGRSSLKLPPCTVRKLEHSQSGDTLLHIPTSVLFCKTGWKTTGKHIAAIAISNLMKLELLKIFNCRVFAFLFSLSSYSF